MNVISILMFVIVTALLIGGIYFITFVFNNWRRFTPISKFLLFSILITFFIVGNVIHFVVKSVSSLGN
ncbi:hypothetical protein AB447_203885 [Bacillus glycinifermentans]|uniref:Uncharacterized protein n=1 Tax=Bacillus glycinifermentans TaxID=1664069 RepID=A0A0T6BN78_9BACI|nr:hypothetical protein AB447_203885 [Bacillus glycinifermentans]